MNLLGTFFLKNSNFPQKIHTVPKRSTLLNFNTVA